MVCMPHAQRIQVSASSAISRCESTLSDARLQSTAGEGHTGSACMALPSCRLPMRLMDLVIRRCTSGTVKFAGNTVWSVPERFWGGVPRRGAISSVLTFTFTFTTVRQVRYLRPPDQFRLTRCKAPLRQHNLGDFIQPSPMPVS